MVGRVGEKAMKVEEEGKERKGMGVRKKGREVLSTDFVTQSSQRMWKTCIIILTAVPSFPLLREQRLRKFEETSNKVKGTCLRS